MLFLRIQLSEERDSKPSSTLKQFKFLNPSSLEDRLQSIGKILASYVTLVIRIGISRKSAHVKMHTRKTP